MAIWTAESGLLFDVRRVAVGFPRRVGKAWRIALLTLLCAGLSAPPQAAKDKKPLSRTVSGFVLDASENGIEGAAVTLKDLQTGRTIAVYSGEGGRYQFADLRFDHDYEVQAAIKGVKSETRQVSSVDTRARLVINLRIPPPGS